jgi:hypothetical protein
LEPLNPAKHILKTYIHLIESESFVISAGCVGMTFRRSRPGRRSIR